METGKGFRESEVVVSTNLPETMAETSRKTSKAIKSENFKTWKKPELQDWLRIHGLKVSGTKEELVARAEIAKLARWNQTSSCTPTAVSRVRVPRGTLLLLCHSYKGKFVNGKQVTLHRLPLDLKLRREWIRKLKTVRKNLKPKAGTRVCSLHFRGADGPKPWCKLPTLFPSKPPPKSPTRKRPLSDRFEDRCKGSLSKHGLRAGKLDNIEVVNVYNSTKFEDCFHDYLPSSYCPGSIFADIIKKFELISVLSFVQVQRTKTSRLKYQNVMLGFK